MARPPHTETGETMPTVGTTGVQRGEGLAVAAVRGAAWTAVSKWAIRLCSLATFALLARLIAPAEFGLVAMATAILEVLRVLAQQGFSHAIVRERDLTREMTDTAFWLTLIGGVATAGTLVLAAPGVESLVAMPGLAPLLQVMAVYVVLTSAGAVPEALLSRDLSFKTLAVRTTVATLAGIAVAVTMAAVGAGVWALVGQTLVQALVGTVLLWRSAGYRPRGGIRTRSAASTIRFGWVVLGIDLGTAALGQIDKLVIGSVLGEASLGYYALAFKLISTLDDTLVGVFSTLALPLFSRIQNDRHATLRALTTATRATLTAAAPVYLTTAVLAPVLVPLAFGPGWEVSIPILQVLCLAGLLASTTYFDRGVLLAAGRPGLELVLVLVFGAGTLLAAYVGSAAGVLGATVAIAARMYLTWPLRIIALRLALPLRLGRFLVAWLPAVAASVLFAGTVVLFRTLVLPGTSTLHLIVHSAAALAVYILFLAVVDHRFLTGMVATVRRGLRRSVS